jgi:hypothetical protein
VDDEDTHSKNIEQGFTEDFTAGPQEDFQSKGVHDAVANVVAKAISLFKYHKRP